MRVKTKCRMGNLCAIRKGDGECEKNCYYNTREVKTNADRIRAMTDEELAGFCAHTLPYAPWCDYDKENGWCELESCEPCALDWLKQEAKE